MMATTIINSIKVKPCCTFFMIEKLLAALLKRFPLHRRPMARLGGDSASAVPLPRGYVKTPAVRPFWTIHCGRAVMRFDILPTRSSRRKPNMRHKLPLFVTRDVGPRRQRGGGVAALTAC